MQLFSILYLKYISLSTEIESFTAENFEADVATDSEEPKKDEL